ncbi:MAG: acetyl-coenzyme A synthetase N-terminal domain-containing protein, partial [Desulfofustis sp.]|nr:acetyl-coenzyme A synthetase N-terminal domain-containing protein [Desulfofustis sp.]
MADYDKVFAESVQNPEAFWATAAAELDWYQTWNTVLDASNPPFYRWFSGGLMNTCYNAVDRHVAGGRGDQVA